MLHESDLSGEVWFGFPATASEGEKGLAEVGSAQQAQREEVCRPGMLQGLCMGSLSLRPVAGQRQAGAWTSKPALQAASPC